MMLPADPLYSIPQSGVFKRQFPGAVISLIAGLGQISGSFNYKLRVNEAPVYRALRRKYNLKSI